MTRRSATALGALALAVVALVSLPLVYLVIRVVGGGSRAWSVLERPRTLDSVGRTVGLVATVTAIAVAIGLPSAWLVTRTDLPARRVWAVVLALPLVLPSYVIALALIAVSGPGGLLGVPAIDGFDGSVAALALATYPYVFLLCAAALRRADRSQEEAARSLGASPARVLWRVTLPALRAPLAASTLLVVLYALSDFGVVSLMRFNALTRAIFVQYKTLFDRTGPAVLGAHPRRDGGRGRGARGARRGPVAARPRGRGGGARARAGRARRAGSLRGARLLRAGRGVALVLPVAVLGVWAARSDGGPRARRPGRARRSTRSAWPRSARS